MQIAHNGPVQKHRRTGHEDITLDAVYLVVLVVLGAIVMDMLTSSAGVAAIFALRSALGL